jgi:hypothetical protein
MKTLRKLEGTFLTWKKNISKEPTANTTVKWWETEHIFLR